MYASTCGHHDIVGALTNAAANVNYIDMVEGQYLLFLQ
jgi:hypothetical protein